MQSWRPVCRLLLFPMQYAGIQPVVSSHQSSSRWSIKLSRYPDQQLFYLRWLSVVWASNISYLKDSFCQKGRKTRLEHLRTKAETIILYESPHRLFANVAGLATIFWRPENLHFHANWRRNLKEHIRGTIGTVSQYFSNANIRGEFRYVIAVIISLMTNDMANCPFFYSWLFKVTVVYVSTQIERVPMNICL